MPTEYQATLTKSYDRFLSTDAFYINDRSDLGFANLGLFLPDTRSFGEACENLLKLVVAKLTVRPEAILDVACGLGGTTKFISAQFPAARAHGINISDFQIEQCRQRVPTAQFDVMPAERMSFPDASFDAVICVEAAMHFKGRREFLDEAYRILKPGGEIVVADMVFDAEPTTFKMVMGGQEIYPDLGSYLALWESCGFANPQLDDITQPSWRKFTQFHRNTAFRELMDGKIDRAKFDSSIHFANKIDQLPALAYVVVYGRKSG